jgi:hypothetical protein
MGFKRWALLTLIVVVALFGTGYWVNANQHMEKENGHMMKEGRHGHMMHNGQHRDMMRMPMMHANMSEEEMKQFCSKMQERHSRMRNLRQKNAKTLQSLVQSMRKASGTDKIKVMETLLIELVEQHNRRGTMMMGSMRTMMGSMMGMHRMSPQNRQKMMETMRNCPMMKGSMSPSEHGHNDSKKEHHGQ